MFDRLQERLARTLRTLRGVGKIREGNISQALEEVRASLLEADVHYRVVQSFVDSVKQRALGASVLDRVEPGQQFVKIVFDELKRVLGDRSAELPGIRADRPLCIMLAGLQGCGKTTTAAKLAKHLRDERGARPLLVPADTARPAAREQLARLAKENGLGVFESREPSAAAVCREARRAAAAREVAADCLIFDTAGRLHVDGELMAELREVRQAVRPDLTLYVLDAMAGQDAVRAARAFSEQIGFDGVVVAKADGDARGGALLSVKLVTGRAIYFLGVGEKIGALEPFHPDRYASRILGMGDVVTLVEKAQEAIDAGKAEALARKLRKNQFTIEDFAEQLRVVRKMGSMEQLLDYLPGGREIGQMIPGGLPEGQMDKVDAIIKSMTRRERTNHQLIDGSRRKRIAAGSGTAVADVNRFLKQFLQAKTMMSRWGRIGVKGMRRGGLGSFG